MRFFFVFTGIDMELLKYIGAKSVEVPEGFVSIQFYWKVG